MSSEDQDEASKTEEPTGKRIEDARKKGQLPATRELNHFFMILAMVFFLGTMATPMIRQSVDVLTPFITEPERVAMDAPNVAATLSDLTINIALILALPLLLTFIAAIAPTVLQNKWVFSGEGVKPKFKNISPLAGVKRIFSVKALIEFLKNLVKISLLGAVCFTIMMPYARDLPGLLRIDSFYSIEFSGMITQQILIGTCIFLFLISIGDYLWQRRIFLKQNRMTKQEVKDEYKQMEGDPHHKAKIKQMRVQRSRQRMMANVPKADVIITNPTHYAIALQYDPSRMAVPKVVAKGVDDVAARIREVAQANRVTIIRNPPLARMLYDTTEIDEDIPTQHYKAVAQIISYVYKLKGKKAGSPPRSSKPAPRKR